MYEICIEQKLNLGVMGLHLAMGAGDGLELGMLAHSSLLFDMPVVVALGCFRGSPACSSWSRLLCSVAYGVLCLAAIA